MSHPAPRPEPLSSFFVLAALLGLPGLFVAFVGSRQDLNVVYGLAGKLFLAAAIALVLVGLVAWAVEIGIRNAHASIHASGERAAQGSPVARENGDA